MSFSVFFFEIKIFYLPYYLPAPCWMQWLSWTCTLDCGLETRLFIIFLITHEEITVYFSSQDVLDIRIFYLMTEGKQEGKRHWFFRTGNCTPVWRNGRHQCHMKHHWHCSFFTTSNSFQPKKALIKFTEKCQCWSLTKGNEEVSSHFHHGILVIFWEWYWWRTIFSAMPSKVNVRVSPLIANFDEEVRSSDIEI